MKDSILEVCADSVESVLAAEKGGADRIELCSNIVIGGTTPSESLFREIRRYSDIRIHALIRPRFGDFCYTEYEFNIIKDEVKRFRELGAQGVVIGMLKPDGTMDMERMKALMEESGDMSVTLHRAFDVCKDWEEALEQSVSLGINTILTSGQHNNCMEGMDVLKELQKKSQGRIRIMAGAGINAQAISVIHQATGIQDYHMTGKILMDSEMKYRKEGVNMGLPCLSEFEIFRTDENEVRKARNVINEL